MILVVSRRYFRGRGMGTPRRVVLSVVAAGLLAVSLMRDGGLDAGRIVVLVLTVAVLAAGVVCLSRENGPRE